MGRGAIGYGIKLVKPEIIDKERLIAIRLGLYENGLGKTEVCEMIAGMLHSKDYPLKKHPMDYIADAITNGYILFEEKDGKIIYKKNKELYSDI